MSRTSLSIPEESTGQLLFELNAKLEDESNELHHDTTNSEYIVSGQFHVLEEARKLFHIALPSILIQFSMLFIFPQAASAVGRMAGTVELAGFSLGSLVGNTFCLSVMEGALSAADTLMPRAYSAERYEEVGRLAIRGFFVCILLLLPPIIPLCSVTGWVLKSLGQDPTASELAQEWIRIYFLGFPATLIFRVELRFLLAQQKPWPLVYATVIPCLFVQPFLLGYLVPKLGLPGSAWAISLTQWTTTIMLAVFLWFKPMHKPETWPGLSWTLLKESLRPGPFSRFFNLSLGGVFSLSEWWFWEIMCFIAGSFGVVPLCVHTIAYNLVPLLFMLPLGVMIGLVVRMGHVIEKDVRRAKMQASWVMGVMVFVAAIVSTLLYFLRLSIIKLFTNDEEVIRGALRIWIDLCLYIFFIYIFGINCAIMRALGLQWRLAVITSVFLYLLVLPSVVYFAIYKGGQLYAQWTVLPSFYFFMQVALILSYTLVNWEKQTKLMKHSMHDSTTDMVMDIEPHEDTPLL